MLLQDLPRSFVVVYNQDALTPEIGIRGWWPFDGLGRNPERDREEECAAFAWLALHSDLAAHQFHELSADGEAEAGAAKPACGRRVSLAEGTECVLLFLLGHADPGILDSELYRHSLANAVNQFNRNDYLTRLCELDRIVREIDEHLT